MNPRIVAAQLAIFFVISVSIISYTLFGLIGIDPTEDPTEVTVQLPVAGGSFEGSEVTFRGVGVGRVTRVELRRDGVTLHLSIDEDRRIPADSTANVRSLSVAGEQYVDLVPRTTGGRSLRSGDVIPVSRTTTPRPLSDVLLDVEQLVTSLNPGDIRTVTQEFALAFANSGPQLRQILDAGGSIVKQLSDSRAAVLRLARNGRVVLDTITRNAGDFRVFADSLNKLTASLKTSTPDIEQLVAQSPGTVRVLDQLVRDNASSAAILMGNLVTFGRIQVANIPGLKALLVAVPEFGQLLPKVVRDGRIQAGLLINYDQRVCATGVPLTSPLSGQRSPIYKATCPDPALLPRGAANAPRSGGGAQVSTYDSSGLVRTGDGRTVRLGADGGQGELFGSKSWQTLLLPGGGP